MGFEICKSIRRADAVIICFSQNSVTKEGYVQKEIRYALDIADEKPEETIYLIPVRFVYCQVPTRLARLQWYDLIKMAMKNCCWPLAIVQIALESK